MCGTLFCRYAAHCFSFGYHSKMHRLISGIETLIGAKYLSRVGTYVQGYFSESERSTRRGLRTVDDVRGREGYMSSNQDCPPSKVLSTDG